MTQINRWMMHTVTNLSKTYISMVESDGGIVVDKAYLDACYNKLIQCGVYSKLRIWISPNLGIKKDGSNRVSKMYNLIGAFHAVSTIEGTMPIWVERGVQWNYKPYLLTSGKTMQINNIPIPLYNEIFWGVESLYSPRAVWFQHGEGSNPVNGFQHTSPSRWLTSVDNIYHWANSDPSDVKTTNPLDGCINHRRLYSQRYNNTLNGGNIYTDKLLNVNSTVSGTIKTNQINTQNFYFLRHQPDTMIDFIIFDELSDVNYLTIRDYIRYIYNGINLIFDGDSRTHGVGATENGSYPDQLYLDIRTANTAKYAISGYNFGVAGQTLDQMIADAANQIDTLFLPDSMIIVFGCYNQWAKNSLNIIDSYNKTLSYCQQRQASGFKVFCLTEIDQQYNESVQWGIDYVWYNTQILANFPSLGIHVIDISVDIRLQDASNTTYFNADKIHLTNSGYSVIKDIVKSYLIDGNFL